MKYLLLWRRARTKKKDLPTTLVENEIKKFKALKLIFVMAGLMSEALGRSHSISFSGAKRMEILFYQSQVRARFHSFIRKDDGEQLQEGEISSRASGPVPFLLSFWLGYNPISFLYRLPCLATWTLATL